MTILGTYEMCGRCYSKATQCPAKNVANGVKDTFVCKRGHVNFIPYKQ